MTEYHDEIQITPANIDQIKSIWKGIFIETQWQDWGKNSFETKDEFLNVLKMDTFQLVCCYPDNVESRIYF